MSLLRRLKCLTDYISATKNRLIILAIVAVFIVIFSLVTTQTFSATLAESDTSAIIKLNDRQETYDLSNHLEFLEDKDSNLTIERISSAEFINQFKHSDRHPPNFGYTTSTYWGKVQVENSSDRHIEKILSIEHPHIDHISLYFRDINSSENWKIKTTGLLYPFSSRDIPDRLPAFQINIAPQTTENIYLRFQSTTPIVIKAYLRAPITFWQYRTTQNLWLGMIGGILVFAFLYNLFLFTALKDKVYLSYILFVLGILVCVLAYDGFGLQYLWQNAVLWNKYAVPITLLVGLINLLESVHLFLETKKYLPRWHLLLRSHQALLFLLLICLFVLPLRLVMFSAIFVCVSVCCLAIVLGIIALTRGYLPARYYLLSFSCLLVTLSAYQLSLSQIIPNYEWMKDGYRISIVIFVILLSLALADRINLLKAEKLREQKLAIKEKDLLNANLQQAQTQLLEREQQLEYDLLHDALTGSPNRTWLTQRLEYLLQQRQQFAILFVDLDRFKVINDSLGHLVGDELLRHSSKRIQSILPKLGTVTRFGGDEFVVLLEEITELETVTKLADLLQMQMQLPFHLHNYELFISASVGITLNTEEYQHPQELLRDADLAMYQAKHKGRGRYALFTKSDRTLAMNRLNLEQDLRHALERKEIYLLYQPIVSLKDQQICGFEALVRWKHPSGKLISPVEFIPIAEETGLINSLGWWIMQEACQQTQFWNQKLKDEFSFQVNSLSINVNVSPIQLRQTDFIKTLKQILLETDLPNHCLKIEITENCLLENIDSDANLLNHLKNLGIKLCIDDFGTGYSSLSRLYELPIDTLKIDQSFVKRIGSQLDSTVIIETIAALAKSLNMHIVAEGVETQAQLEKLMLVGCNFGQGYLFSKPCDLPTAYKLLQKQLLRS